MNAPVTLSNNPPTDANPLRDRLTESYADMLTRAEELVAAAARVPECTDDEIAGKIGDFVKQCAAHQKLLDTTRVGEKEPFLAGGRTVDGFFNVPKERLEKALVPVRGKVTVYLRAKAERERREAEEAARRQREEAARLAREAAEREAASKAESAALMDKAAAVETEAVKAEQSIADAKPADFARTRGDLGSVSTLQRRWTFRDMNRTELDLNMLRPYLPADALEKALNAFIKAGGRQIAGATIYEAETASFR